MAMAPDGSLVVTGQASLGFLDWYTVAFETTGAVRWEAVRDGGLNTDEIPAAVFVLPDGNRCGHWARWPKSSRRVHPGCDGGVFPCRHSVVGGLLSCKQSGLRPFPSGDVCATGGYDALITCWDVSSGANPPQPTSVVSRKTHGMPGAFDIDLSLTGNAGIECRSGGTNSDYQIVFTFPTAVTLGGASVTPAPGKSGRMVGQPNLSADGKTVTLDLTNVTDAQTIAVTLSGVSNGTNTNDVTAQMKLLVGDTNGNGVVNASDVSQTNCNPASGYQAQISAPT